MLLKSQSLVIDLNSHLVLCCQQPISLSCRELDFLVYQVKNKNRTCTFAELLYEVSHYEPNQANYQIVRQTVWRLRHKFQKCTCNGASLTIRNVREIGFCFDCRAPACTGSNQIDTKLR